MEDDLSPSADPAAYMERVDAEEEESKADLLVGKGFERPLADHIAEHPTVFRDSDIESLLHQRLTSPADIMTLVGGWEPSKGYVKQLDTIKDLANVTKVKLATFAHAHMRGQRGTASAAADVRSNRPMTTRELRRRLVPLLKNTEALSNVTLSKYPLGQVPAGQRQQCMCMLSFTGNDDGSLLKPDGNTACGYWYCKACSKTLTPLAPASMLREAKLAAQTAATSREAASSGGGDRAQGVEASAGEERGRPAARLGQGSGRGAGRRRSRSSSSGGGSAKSSSKEDDAGIQDASVQACFERLVHSRMPADMQSVSVPASGGYRSIAHAHSPAANIVTHAATKSHLQCMQEQRAIARSQAGGFPTHRPHQPFGMMDLDEDVYPASEVLPVGEEPPCLGYGSGRGSQGGTAACGTAGGGGAGGSGQGGAVRPVSFGRALRSGSGERLGLPPLAPRGIAAAAAHAAAPQRDQRTQRGITDPELEDELVPLAAPTTGGGGGVASPVGHTSGGQRSGSRISTSTSGAAEDDAPGSGDEGCCGDDDGDAEASDRSRDRLAEAEACIVRAAARFFIEASAALLDICENRLYTAVGYRSFADYVVGTPELGFGYRQARAWVAAARFVRRLPCGSRLPDNERQVRPLVGLPVATALTVWQDATQRASQQGGPRMSAALVLSCMQGAVGAAHDMQGGVSGADGDCGGGNGRPVFLESRNNEWYTPDAILALVAELFAPGVIELDPCSTAAANTRVGARAYYDAAADGLAAANAWTGNVFVNPPFGTRAGRSLQGLFFEKARREACAGEHECRTHTAV